MRKGRKLCAVLMLCVFVSMCSAEIRTVNVADFGARPDNSSRPVRSDDGSVVDSQYYPYSAPLGGAVAKYVKIKAKSNWSSGITNKYGLSEVRFFYIPLRARKPSPDLGATDVGMEAILSFRAGRQAVEHDVYFGPDEQAVIDGTVYVDTVNQTLYDAGTLELGKTYYWRIDEVNNLDANSP